MTSPLSTENPTPGRLIYEYLLTLCPPNHDVMQHTRRVKAGLSWHGVYFPFFLCQLIFLPASPLFLISDDRALKVAGAYPGRPA